MGSRAQTRRAAIFALVIASPACGAGSDSGATAGSSGSGAVTGDSTASQDASGSSGSSGASGMGTAQATADATSGSGSAGSTGIEELPCNGHALLCDRPFPAVVFPTTHNSVAATDDGFSPLNANQVQGVEAQLQAGIRGLLLDVTYDDAGDTALCHGPCSLGSRPHVEVMAALETFLADNPREVVAIIYQDSVDPADVAADYDATGLDTRVFTKIDGESWPTLREMIDADTRLVVTAEAGGPPPAWYHHVWELAWDTPYSFTSTDEFSCALNRGSMDNELMLLNHWLSTEAGLPAPTSAATANAYDVLHARAVECTEAAGRAPTFVAVDFHETGDLFAVVDALNGLP